MVQMMIDDAVLNDNPATSATNRTTTTTKPTAKPATLPVNDSPELQRRRTLFQISGDMLALDDLLDETGGEIADEQTGTAIDAWFAELATERDRKLDGYVSLLKECEARSAARKQRASEIAELARLDAKKVEFLKRRLLEFMQLHGLKRIDTDRSRLSVCTNGGKAPLVILNNATPMDVPEEFRRVIVETSIDTDKVRAALEGGKELEFAEIMPRGEHLRIK